MSNTVKPTEQKFPCQESGCREIVGFHYEPVFAWGAKNPLEGSGSLERAYLTCGRNHVHPYEVVL